MKQAAGGLTRVFLLDDHEVVLRGIANLIASQDDMVVVGEARTCAEALVRVPALAPDVAVLDINLPDGDGVSVCRELRTTVPGLACLMFTNCSDDDTLLNAIRAGAAGFALKAIPGESLVEAIRTVADGRSNLDPHASARVMERLRNSADAVNDPLVQLTPQEHRILELIGEGLTNREIGEAMFLAEKTVKNYISTVLSKLGMQRRTQIAALAAQIELGGARSQSSTTRTP